MPLRIFLSYTREKDAYNAVSSFREHLQSELKVKTGDSELQIFQDIDITFGMSWQEKLYLELDTATCLIILLSPLWLNSKFCNDEYFHYCNKKSATGNIRPIIPIMWDETSQDNADSQEKLAILNHLMSLEKVDWTTLKYEQWDSTIKQIAVSELAKSIKKMVLLTKNLQFD